ncbi:sugar nucleotidyltransferase [Candidatus Pelagibacter sp. HIMB1495]|uniref:sugar nucleotidyltransferase n=1 Tax=unclassified Candidatus Pelagibacter TaxID=2647897 RepID=UPI003F856C3A
MIKKGIVLAGGKGSRLSPLTKAVNKQLLPIYSKPLIFYSLSILMLARIKDILIIVNKGELDQYKKILPNGKNLGIKIQYKEQENPNGLPEAFIIGESFIKNQNVVLILGDNFFYGQNLSSTLINASKMKTGAKIILHQVNKPQLYGVAKIDKNNNILKIEEKPKKFISNKAITGLYFFDNKVIKYSKKLKKSKRGELEITDILKIYKKNNKLKPEILGRGAVWMDTGSLDDFYKTSSFVSAIEKRQGIQIACLEEIALINKWITSKEIKKAIKFYGNSEYSTYLKNLL